MNNKIYIYKNIKKDLKDIINWYENKKNNLGNDFLIEFENLVELIKNNPFIFQITYNNIRIARFNKFS